MHTVHKVWRIAADAVWSARLCVFVCHFNSTKMVEPIDVFVVWTCVGPRKHALDRGQDLHRKICNFGDVSQPTVKYREYLA